MSVAMSPLARSMHVLPVVMAALALSGCGGMIPPAAVPKPAFTPATRPEQQPPLPQQQRSTGIIGADARALVRQFGEPRLDIRDPAARKLQFGDGRCVLDAYLYPPRERREPVVTFAEARAADGSAMDVASCVAQLTGR